MGRSLVLVGHGPSDSKATQEIKKAPEQEMGLHEDASSPVHTAIQATHNNVASVMKNKYKHGETTTDMARAWGPIHAGALRRWPSHVALRRIPQIHKRTSIKNAKKS